MGMLYFIRGADGVLTGYTETDDDQPGAADPRYVPWDQLPVDPPFSSFDDAQWRASDYVGMELSADWTTLTPAPPPQPYPVPQMTVLEFRDRYTVAEKQAIYDAAVTDTMVTIIIDDLNNAEFVNIEDQHTINGVDYLISSGVIDASRREALLAPYIIYPSETPADGL